MPGAASRSQVELTWRDSAGRVRAETRQLTPGWHTVLLGHPDTTVD